MTDETSLAGREDKYQQNVDRLGKLLGLDENDTARAQKIVISNHRVPLGGIGNSKAITGVMIATAMHITYSQGTAARLIERGRARSRG